jgi:hypothetical protein
VSLAQLLVDPAHGIMLNPRGKAFILVGPEGIHQRAGGLALV